MTTEKTVRHSFLEQAEICASLGSDFMFHLCKGLGEHLDKSTQTGKRVLEWQGDPQPKGNALALRLAGGLHAIVRRGEFPSLSQYYDHPKSAVDAGFINEILALIALKDEELLTWLDNAPQTNEVARSSIVFAGLSVVAEQYKMPISLFELGASGGLNLQVAEFGYEFAGKKFGAQNSDLNLTPKWEGALPPRSNINIVSKRGCDLNPLSVEKNKDCEKLIAYLWPDQKPRIERVNAAIKIARKSPPVLDKADAADWIENEFLTAKNDGVVKVLFHTIAQNYFPQSVKDRIQAAIKSAANQATKESPVAWLAFEFEGEGNPKLILKTWPDGGNHILATADPHVYGVKWIN